MWAGQQTGACPPRATLTATWPSRGPLGRGSGRTHLRDDVEVVPGLPLDHNLLSVFKLHRLQGVGHGQALPLLQGLWRGDRSTSPQCHLRGHRPRPCGDGTNTREGGARAGCSVVRAPAPRRGSQLRSQGRARTWSQGRSRLRSTCRRQPVSASGASLSPLSPPSPPLSEKPRKKHPQVGINNKQKLRGRGPGPPGAGVRTGCSHTGRCSRSYLSTQRLP